jgi:hypothetical protein
LPVLWLVINKCIEKLANPYVSPSILLLWKGSSGRGGCKRRGKEQNEVWSLESNQDERATSSLHRWAEPKFNPRNSCLVFNSRRLK